MRKHIKLLISFIAGSDYVTVRETLVFNSGDTSMCFDVTILGDMEPEGRERFILQLTSDSSATIGSPGSAIVTIDDDDSPGTWILYLLLLQIE